MQFRGEALPPPPAGLPLPALDPVTGAPPPNAALNAWNDAATKIYMDDVRVRCPNPECGRRFGELPKVLRHIATCCPEVRRPETPRDASRVTEEGKVVARRGIVVASHSTQLSGTASHVT